jgi:hypothetical protein
VAERTTAHSDHPGAGRGPADLPRATPRRGLDHPGLTAQASPAGRRTSQAERGVVGGSHRPPATEPMPVLRESTVRTGRIPVLPAIPVSRRGDLPCALFAETTRADQAGLVEAVACAVTGVAREADEISRCTALIRWRGRVPRRSLWVNAVGQCPSRVCSGRDGGSGRVRSTHRSPGPSGVVPGRTSAIAGLQAPIIGFAELFAYRSATWHVAAINSSINAGRLVPGRWSPQRAVGRA